MAKDGQLVLDPAEYKKAPQQWALSQGSAEAIFHAYNSSFQTAMVPGAGAGQRVGGRIASDVCLHQKPSLGCPMSPHTTDYG